jgi:hypothetical protein
LRRLASPGSRRAAPSTGMGGAAPGFIDALAESRHEALFRERLRWPRSPEGFRAEDVTGAPDLEGFVSVEEAAKRMEIEQDEVARDELATTARARLEEHVTL